MIFDMNRQVTLFIFSLIAGMLLGVIFDIYRVIRGIEEPGTILTAIEDILFWILAAVLIFIFMMYTNYAYMSFNVFIYNAIGMALYFKFISRGFIYIFNVLLKGILSIIRIGFNYIFYPARIIFNRIAQKEKKKI